MHRRPCRQAPFPLDSALRAGIAGLTLLAAALAIAGCAGGAPGPVPQREEPTLAAAWPQEQAVSGPARADCDLPAGPVAPGGDFVFAVFDSVRPRLAPVPRNRAERVVFAQLYETLVRVGCDGTASPGLAEHWSCGADSSIWVFTLREEAKTWDGQRVTALDVWRSWQENRAAPVDDGGSPWNWFDPRTGSVSVLDTRRLAVRLPEPQRRFPLLLAHPATAVAVRRAGWTWPLGSGPCRLTATDGAPRPLLRCRPNPDHPRAPTWDSLVFRVLPGRLAAESAAAEAPPDLVWTRDLAAVQRFLARPEWRARALPWDRTLLLVCPPALARDRAAAWSAAAAGLVPERDVVTVSARRWEALTLPEAAAQRCPQLSGPVAAARGDVGEALAATLAASPVTVAFPQDDPAARDLAARLVQLAGGPARAVPLSAAAAATALHRGEACALVVPVPQSYADGCLQMAALLGRAAWLQDAALTATTADIDQALIANNLAHPLAVTRAWLLTRDGLDDELSGVTMLYDACPDLAGLGRRDAAGSE
ncbi:MAG: hypothetical protein IPK64_14495 [bacterium]|nr:hypothetical protein [bacterium]